MRDFLWSDGHSTGLNPLFGVAVLRLFSLGPARVTGMAEKLGCETTTVLDVCNALLASRLLTLEKGWIFTITNKGLVVLRLCGATSAHLLSNKGQGPRSAARAGQWPAESVANLQLSDLDAQGETA